jgi:deoxyhypusine synthase
MKSGIEYMVFLSDWYPKIVQTVLVFSNRWWNSRRFPNMCGMLYQDMEMHDVPFGVISVKFQIQQLVTVPILEQYQKKITWGKLDIKTPKFIIESMLLL